MLASTLLRESKTPITHAGKSLTLHKPFPFSLYKTNDFGKGRKHRMACKVAHTMLLQLDKEYVTNDSLSTPQLYGEDLFPK